MKVYLPVFVIIVPLFCSAQIENQDKNFVSTETMKVPITDPNIISTLPVVDKNTNVTYYDGLGRLIQTVEKQGSPLLKDVVIPVAYDQYGRQVKEYLPYISTGADGHYKPNALGSAFDPTDYLQSDHYDYYTGEAINVAHDPHPYAEKFFENSPLNRIIKQGAPGAVWQPNKSTPIDDPNDHSVKFSYETNAAGKVYLWQVDNEDRLYCTATYGAGELYKNVTYDEESHQIIEFVDKLGRTLLKKVQENEGTTLTWVETYYVYDDFGRLRFVLSPEAVDNIGNAQVPAGYELLKSNYTIETSTGKYMYLPGVTVTISPDITLTPELIIKPYPVTTDLLSDWAFQYKYDGRGRMVAKKVPGADWVYMVYDQWDRLVLTQDGNQREDDQWIFTKYDVLNRPVMTGIVTDLRTAEAIQTDLADELATTRNEIYDGTGDHGYTMNSSFPKLVDGDINEILTVTYYDDYDHVKWSTAFDPSDLGVFDELDNKIPPRQNIYVKGQITGTKTKVLNTTSWITTTNYYDDRYRLIQTITDNPYQSVTDIATTQYDFAGQVRHTHLDHTFNGTSTTIQKRYAYDHMGRLEEVYHKIGSDPEILLVKNEYNELGELIDKKLFSEDNGATFAQSVDYRYNIRGWLTRINDAELSEGESDYFGMNLAYNDNITGISSTAAHNGNISAIKWSNGIGLNDLQERAYSYTYDPMNRLSSAQHHKQLLGTWANTPDYSVEGLDYDKNGNIESLDRRGAQAAEMDALSYTYDGNQLLTVTDDWNDDEGFKDGNAGSRDYFYDDNGNMIKDVNKGITHIEYNHLNLPERVEKGTGTYIDYFYDAAGVKLAQEVYEGGAQTKRTDYIGTFIYEGIGDKELQLIQHEEGRIVKHAITGAWEYQYYLKDHLGNNRVVFTTLPKTHIFKATMESQAEEQADDAMFFNISDIPVDTEATSYDQVQRLLAGAIDGAGISLPVYPGDKVSMKVQGFYRNGDGSSTAGLDALITAVAGIFGGVDGGAPAEQRIYDAFESYYDPTLGGVGLRQPTAGDIAAYLNYILFDKNMNSVQDGFVPVDYAASGTAMEINIPEQVVSEEGILYVYLTNESNAEVYFDDFEIKINEHPVVQTDNYYPFGLTFNSWQRSTAKEIGTYIIKE